MISDDVPVVLTQSLMRGVGFMDIVWTFPWRTEKSVSEDAIKGRPNLDNDGSGLNPIWETLGLQFSVREMKNVYG